jgi:hypothetical protein
MGRSVKVSRDSRRISIDKIVPDMRSLVEEWREIALIEDAIPPYA